MWRERIFRPSTERAKGWRQALLWVRHNRVKEMDRGKEQSLTREHQVKVILLAESQDSQIPFSGCL